MVRLFNRVLLAEAIAFEVAGFGGGGGQSVGLVMAWLGEDGGVPEEAGDFNGHMPIGSASIGSPSLTEQEAKDAWLAWWVDPNFSVDKLLYVGRYSSGPTWVSVFYADPQLVIRDAVLGFQAPPLVEQPPFWTIGAPTSSAKPITGKMAVEGGALEAESWGAVPVGAGQEPLRVPLEYDHYSGGVRVKSGATYILTDGRKERPW